MGHSIRPLSSLSIHDISAMALSAVQRGESLAQANVYEGHIGTAFAGAYLSHFDSSRVEVLTPQLSVFFA